MVERVPLRRVLDPILEELQRNPYAKRPTEEERLARDLLGDGRRRADGTYPKVDFRIPGGKEPPPLAAPPRRELERAA